MGSIPHTDRPTHSFRSTSRHPLPALQVSQAFNLAIETESSNLRPLSELLAEAFPSPKSKKTEIVAATWTGGFVDG